MSSWRFNTFSCIRTGWLNLWRCGPLALLKQEELVVGRPGLAGRVAAFHFAQDTSRADNDADKPARNSIVGCVLPNIDGGLRH